MANDDQTYYIDSNGGAHFTPQEAVDANLQIESSNGQYVTGGNCGQSADNIRSDDKGESNDKK